MPNGQYSVTNSFGGGGAVGPFLVPSGASAGNTVTIYVVGPVAPNVRSGNVTLPSVMLPSPAPTTQSTFTLSIFSPQGNSPLPAVQVNVDKGAAWSSDSTQRAAMAMAFKVFRAQLEALESVSSPPLLPGASNLIVNRLASAMPLRFDEILSYYYAFDPVAQSIDLLPGMSLRVDWAGYQYCNGPGGAGAGLNGFGTTGSSNLEILLRPDGTLAFDGFSAQFTQGISLQPPTECPLLAGGPVDLQLLGNGRRHLRLVWPTSFSGAGSVDNSGSSNQLSCILLGASSFADIEAATAAVVAGQSACGSQSSGADPIVSIVFVGRVTLVPQVRVWVMGTQQLVPIGTTVRNLVQRFADPIPMQMQQGSATSNLQLAVQRWGQPNMQPIDRSTPRFNIGAIDLSQAASAVGPLGDGFDTPLIKGDYLTIYLPGTS
ncbi:hypothetical protein C8R31_10660 [Nitrosospira sp. Nsp2]|uniref:hypothetical protein n=1 Tax=Nitrosospira sp. Nsp2 TaxID=136548 RepID=UPI000D2FA9D8|nr:hypothetical protein [Nitrosospira sp. Nsp2]PTR14388.1 hypothetical protein C8R31_10660 [Nitrosospira sp. Nsp2]